MIVIGLTGSIGMGKSTTAQLFAQEGASVWDADDAVHRLYAPGGKAVEPVLTAFPKVGDLQTGIDREKLSLQTLGQPDRLKALESIVHPLVRDDQMDFLDQARAKGAAIALLDIPLLVEGGMASLFDAVVVVTADLDARKARVLQRPGMTRAKLDSILARQASEEERLAIADYVVRTDRGVPSAHSDVKSILAKLREKHGLDKPVEPS